MTDTLATLTVWAERMLAIERAEDALRQSIGFNVDAQYPEAVANMQAEYTRAVEELVGDADGWCGDYLWERDMGARRDGKPVEIRGKRYPLRTVKQLARVIELTREGAGK